MDWFHALPLEWRLTFWALVGVLVGSQVNRGIYRLAWTPRQIGPWSAPLPEVPPRHWTDRIPVVGWFFLRRESAWHGGWFWVRPLLLEVALGTAFAALYWYEVDQKAVYLVADVPSLQQVFAQYLSHLVLITLMTVATFIDLDEQTIPDAITIPGTWLGLLFAGLLPESRTLLFVPAPIGYQTQAIQLATGTRSIGQPPWPESLSGAWGLALGLGCFLAWCVAILPWTWTTRRGWGRAVRYFLASLVRRPVAKPIGVMGLIGCAAIGIAWSRGGVAWESLLSSLVGLAVGGGLVWLVRIVASMALQQEAMGFGDVTLMAMIGSFTGWQPTLVIFFLAPFTAILIAVAQYLISRRHDIAFGPYLCLATVIWLTKSASIWKQYGLPIFSLGWMFIGIGVSGILLMGGMLQGWRLLRDFLFPWEPDDEEEPSPRVAVHRLENREPSVAREIAQPFPVGGRNRGAHPLRMEHPLQARRSALQPGSRSGTPGRGSQLFRQRGV